MIFWWLRTKSIRTYLSVHAYADGSVVCQRLCVRWSGGQLLLTELGAEMGKQERRTRLEVSGTLPWTSRRKQTAPYVPSDNCSLSNKIKPFPILPPSSPTMTPPTPLLFLARPPGNAQLPSQRWPGQSFSWTLSLTNAASQGSDQPQRSLGTHVAAGTLPPKACEFCSILTSKKHCGGTDCSTGGIGCWRGASFVSMQHFYSTELLLCASLRLCPGRGHTEWTWERSSCIHSHAWLLQEVLSCAVTPSPWSTLRW